MNFVFWLLFSAYFLILLFTLFVNWDYLFRVAADGVTEKPTFQSEAQSEWADSDNWIQGILKMLLLSSQHALVFGYLLTRKYLFRMGDFRSINAAEFSDRLCADIRAKFDELNIL